MSLPRLRAGGRGRRYTPLRGLTESAMALAYAGGWPGRLLARFPPLRRVRVVEHTLPLLPSPRRRPLRIAFASDLHLGPLTPRPLLDDAFAQLTRLAPDVLLLGGDYVFLDATRAIADDLAARLRAVPARLKLAVLGNHDLWADHTVVEDALRRGGAQVLVNQAAFLPPPHDDVAVVGIDDPFTGHVDADRAFAGAAGAALQIALSHAPEGYPHVTGRGARLMMCGHTHGGQVALPSGPVVMYGDLSRRWHAGLYALDDLHLYVSRGVGIVDVPLRLYAPSDVASFTLT